ncbi:MAG: exonuclease SbcCD subunit D [Candidatus Sericytochromatia bacterium]
MKILHFADLHIGVENYGRLNPETGLNSRLEDFLVGLDTIVDTALKEEVDLVLFAGDAFKINEPSNTHQRVFAERIWRLSQHGIPTFLLIGNHDQTNKYGESHALDIYATLSIPNVHVSDRPGIYRISTRAGMLQIATMPHVSRSALMTHDDFAGRTLAEVDRSIVEQVEEILQHFSHQLDPALPAILAAHVGVEQAKMGSEQTMSIGYGFTVPLGVIARPEYQYVALGHVHKHQVLCTDPLVIYPGSVERVDFGEEKEDKGFVIVELEPGLPARHTFVRLDGRRFLTLDVDLAGATDPTAELLAEIEVADIRGAIVRLMYTIPMSRAEEVDTPKIKAALEPAFYAVLRPILEDPSERVRMPELSEATEFHPLQIFEKYLERRDDLHGMQADLLERAQQLWAKVQGEDG